MSDWTSKYAIMRDLVVAQGFDVPAELEGIGVNEKPPVFVTEEDGINNFGPCNGEGDCNGPPDLALIQQMLDMVRDVGVTNCEDPEDILDTRQVVQITKPCHVNIGKDITNIKTGTIPKDVQKNVKQQVKKVKRKRENVAVNSIMQALNGNKPILNMELPREPLKLLKPTDFISDSTDLEIVQSVEKVNGWLDKQVPHTMSRFSGNPLILEPGSMFKRKNGSTVNSLECDSIKSSSPLKQLPTVNSANKTVVSPINTKEPSIPKVAGYPLALDAGSMFKRRSGSTVKSPESVKSPPPQQGSSTIGTYKPSMRADEYYQKYVERSKMKELVQEDVWARAERIMKEIDVKKKLEAEAAAKEAALIESVLVLTAVDNTNLDAPTIDETTINKLAIDTTTTEESIIEVKREANVPDLMEFLQSKQNGPSQESSSSRDLIELPQHRHLLTGECLVCEVVKAHGYDVDKEIYGNAL